ncbi:villin-4-like [Andrographis paniculata]|uniref:villin-4-like n=1 Tax=Andrographis paniculata TaxID=175694 RepID=UPI0021E7D182|nr:villin-4-like [Andrographis paniculata]
MSVSMRDVDPAFQGAGQKAGIEIWRIENFNPVPVPKSACGKFFTGDSYVILKTTALKNGVLHHDIHYWLGKDTSQDEAGTAAIKTVELDAALGGRAVQYREVQGHETEKFLSYFKPCIMPQVGGIASGFKHVEEEEHQTRLYVCKGKHVVRVKEVPFARSTLNHDDVFILDTKSKIFQFNGSNSSIQERAKALEVVQYIKDTYHDGKCEIAAIEDGKLMADADTGEFWTFFGGFAPLPRKSSTEEPKSTDVPSKLYYVEKGETVPVQADSLTRESLDTHRCYVLDCGTEVFLWMGRSTSLTGRKSAVGAVDELLRNLDRSKSHVIRVIEGFETQTFRSKFESWPQSSNVAVTEDGRGKVASLLKRQGFNVKGLLKAETPTEEPQPHIDCTGDLQVWRVDGQQKTRLTGSDQYRFYSGDSYIFQYSYPGDYKDEHLIGTWLGKQSVEEDKVTATSLASKMVESMKFTPTQVRIHDGHEPIQFFAIFQCFIVFKGGLSKGYKNYITEHGLPNETYTEEGLALFRVQGSGPENMQAIQVEPVASSLNSSYSYILHNGPSVFTWSGILTSPEAQELAERQLDLLKPNVQPKLLKEGAEFERFWDMLGGKSEYPSKKIAGNPESDPHLFSCTLSQGDIKVMEIYNFDQDDLMTEDIYILDCHSDIYVWVGQQVDAKNKMNALNIGEKFLEQDFLHEKLSDKAPVYVVMEGSEPMYFTRFFSWDSSKSAMRGNSFQRKIAMIKNGRAPAIDKPKRRSPTTHTGRSAVPDKSQRTRSMSFSPDRVRVRGRSPQFNALAANFEKPNARNLSTPPPMVTKVYPKSVTPDSGKLAAKSAAIAALSSTFEQQPPPARQVLIPRSPKVSPELPKSKPPPTMLKQNSVEKPKPEITKEDVKENKVESDEGRPIYPYELLKTTSTDPITDIDVTKRETYLSSVEFKEKFGMAMDAFYKLPKWKQNKLKMALKLF